MTALLSLLLFLLPLQWAISLPGIPDVPWFRLAALLLILGWTGVILLRPNQKSIPLALSLPVSCFLSLALMSVLLVPEWRGEWLRKYVFLIGLLPLSLVWYAAFMRLTLWPLLKALLLGASASALLGLGIFVCQWLWGAGVMLHFLTETLLPFFLGERLGAMVALYPSLLVDIHGGTWLRLTAVFPDPHVAAFFFGMSACLALGFFQESRKRRWLAVAVLLVTADLLTFSRGGYFGLVAGLGVWTVFFLTKKEWARWSLWILGLLPLLLILAWPVLQRFVSSFLLADASSTERFTLWVDALAVWSYFPFLGVGLGQYADYMYPWMSNELPYYAHNLYLDIGVELGILGLFAWFWLLAAPLALAWEKAWRSGGVALGAVAALSVYAAHSLFETALFSLHVTVILTFALALLAWEARGAKDGVQ